MPVLIQKRAHDCRWGRVAAAKVWPDYDRQRIQ